MPDLREPPWAETDSPSAFNWMMTVIFTELITNNATAVLMFPIAVAVAEQLAIMFAASASFMTPLGYQTNLMVLGLGGYRFTDYLRLGAPLSLIAGVVVVTLVPRVWGFG